MIAGGHLFIPVVRAGGHRYRVRLNLLRRKNWAWQAAVDEYPEGRVTRWWCGPLLVTCMRDR